MADRGKGRMLGGFRNVAGGVALAALAVTLGGCEFMHKMKAAMNGEGAQGEGVVAASDVPGAANMSAAPVDPRAYAQPPMEELKSCGGEAMLPSLGIRFVPNGGQVPTTGRFVREQNLVAPYRVLGPRAMATQDYRPDRLNLDVDGGNVIIRVWCG